MRAIWRSEELQNAAQGALLFENAQSNVIREKLATRKGQEMAGLGSPH
jgi:hypothetical protein